MVKINIAYPPYGSATIIEIDDEKKWRAFLEKRISDEVPADSLGEEFKGYVFKITGGYDKEGFSMMQGVMLNTRTRLLLDGRTGQYTPKRHGCRKRKSVRGCIIGIDMSCINVIIVKRGPTDLPKLTDKASERPSIKGPKRADNIRKAWGLSKKDDVRQYVVKKLKTKEGKKDRIKSPKIQRLITPTVKSRHRRILKLKRVRKERSRQQHADYVQLLKQIRAHKRVAQLSKRREALSSKTSTKLAEKKSTATATEKKPVSLPKEGKAQKKTQVGQPKTGGKGIAKPKTMTQAKEATKAQAPVTAAKTTTKTQEKKPEAKPKTQTKTTAKKQTAKK